MPCMELSLKTDLVRGFHSPGGNSTVCKVRLISPSDLDHPPLRDRVRMEATSPAPILKM